MADLEKENRIQNALKVRREGKRVRRREKREKIRGDKVGEPRKGGFEECREGGIKRKEERK